MSETKTHGEKAFVLNTGRSLMQGISMEAESKWSEKYFNAVAIAEMNPSDIAKLGITDRARIYNENGSVVLRIRPNSNVPAGEIYIPMGPWANMLTDPDTDGTGMPRLKGTKVFVEQTNEPLTSLIDILKELGAKNLEIHMEDAPVKTGERRTVENVVCPFCGDLCDHLIIEIDGNMIVKNTGGCAISSAKFLNYHKHRVLKPYLRHQGKLIEVSLDEALDKAAEILANSKYPLIFGLASTDIEANRYAVELAELTHGVVDNTSVFCHGPTALAVQEAGAVRYTFGVAIHLADLVIFWGCNPLEAHPNHVARIVLREGRFIKGRKSRKIIVIDTRRTPTANLADLFIQVEPGRDYELITALRMAIKDLDIEAPSVAGVPKEKVLELAEMMKTAKYGVIFFGLGLTMTGAKYKNIVAAIKLVQELNEWTKFGLLPMRGHYNVAGSNQVSLWATGYPYAVDYARGFPRMIIGVTSATDLLANGDVDAALIIASDPVAHLPRKAAEHLSRIPVIVIDAKWSLTTAFADVIIPGAYVGIECEGSAYRMDEVPIRLKKLVDPPPGILCDSEVLRRLVEKVKLKKGVVYE
ncbi:MAG: formylmethanofuran dehydrogenase subunit B [Desulfurococcaceae archaeon]